MGVFLKSKHWKYLLEEAGSQVGGLALAAVVGLGGGSGSTGRPEAGEMWERPGLF